ncbi:MAG: hypothetical protein IJA79_06855 [Desulfovibrio sp.]|nr:hypothetical protein [Desulfovibrio sp.]
MPRFISLPQPFDRFIGGLYDWQMQHKIVYSCVVDASKPLLVRQCLVFVTCLIKLCRVSPRRIIVHSVGEQEVLRTFLERYGVRLVLVEPFADRQYCNKLSQLGSPLLAHAEYVCLCDCDMAFAAPMDAMLTPDAICGKVVDVSRPPLHTLQTIFGRYGLPLPSTVPTLSGLTFAGNFNGGLYAGPARLFRHITPVWKAYAHSLLHDAVSLGLLGEWRIHIDQLSFCMAIHKCAVRVCSLPTECNFPLHILQKYAISLTDFHQLCPAIPCTGGAVSAVHYHDLLGADGLISFRCGDPRLDAPLTAINACIAGLPVI